MDRATGQRGLISGGARHAVNASGAFEGAQRIRRSAASRCGACPWFCCAFSVSPLLRNCVIRSASLPALYEEDGAGSRLMSVLLDEITSAHVEEIFTCRCPLRQAPPQDRRSRDGVSSRSANDRRLGAPRRVERANPRARLFTRETE